MRSPRHKEIIEKEKHLEKLAKQERKKQQKAAKSTSKKKNEK